MARLQALADPARYKQIDYSCSLHKRHTGTKKKGETSIMVRVRNERTLRSSYQQGALLIHRCINVESSTFTIDVDRTIIKVIIKILLLKVISNIFILVFLH